MSKITARIIDGRILLYSHRSFDRISRTAIRQLYSRSVGALSSQQPECLNLIIKGCPKSHQADTIFQPGFSSAMSRPLLILKALSLSANVKVVKTTRNSTRMRRQKIKANPLRKTPNQRKSHTPALKIMTTTVKTPYHTTSSRSYAIWWPRICFGGICGLKTHPFYFAAARYLGAVPARWSLCI